MGRRTRTPIHHFTHAKNLPAILDSGRLHCKARLPDSDELVNVSHDSVQEKRRDKRVGCGPGGILHDCVPFYFAPRSPMMYVISKGGVEGYDSNTTPLIYLVSSVERVQEAGLDFVFSDGHPVVALSSLYDDPDDLKRLSWDIIDGRYWHDTEEYPDRTRRRQAEFLVHRSFPWDAVEFLAVKTPNVKSRLEIYLAEQWPDRVRPVRLERAWYF